SLHNALAAGAAEVEARRLAVVSAQAAYEAGEAGLELATRTIVEVLIAQQQLFQAQRDYATARHAFLVNELKLKQAAGILDVSHLEAVTRSLVTDADAALAASKLGPHRPEAARERSPAASSSIPLQRRKPG